MAAPFTLSKLLKFTFFRISVLNSIKAFTSLMYGSDQDKLREKINIFVVFLFQSVDTSLSFQQERL